MKSSRLKLYKGVSKLSEFRAQIEEWAIGRKAFNEEIKCIGFGLTVILSI